MKKIRLNTIKKEYLWSVLFQAPAFIFFTIFLLGPIFFSIFLSFFKWDVIKPMKFYGISNYVKFFVTDPRMGKVILNTIIFIFEVVPASIIIPLILAILLTKIRVARSFFQAIYFLPLVSSTVAISLVWRWVYSTEYGILNSILSIFTDQKISWLRDSRFALLAISIIVIWKTIPINTILFIAAVRNVPSDLHEAARIDGCREIGLFKYVTFPLVTPTIFFVMILTMITSFFNGFDVIKVLTRGGPLDATNIYVYYLYEKAFSNFQFGYASAISVIFFLIILAFTYIQFILQKKWVNY